MPSFRKVPLAGSFYNEKSDHSPVPELFGALLREELTQGESAISKSLKRLRSKSTAAPRQDRHRPPQQRFVSSFTSSRVTVSPSSERIAGRLSDFIPAWEALSHDPVIISLIKGYSLPFLSRPTLVSKPPRFTTVGTLERDLVKLLNKGAIERVSPGTPVWTSSIFGVPKGDGSSRLVINLKPLNKLLIVPHFKMETLVLIRDVVFKGDFCCKVDFADAYFAVNIRNEDRNFLAFRWNNDIFRFNCLPFGLATAPFIYTKLMRVVAEDLRRKGVRLLHYLDDWAFFAQDPVELIKIIQLALNFFESLGLRVNKEKSLTTPTQEMCFLGILLDTKNGDFRIPPNKLSIIKGRAAALSHNPAITAVELSSFLGFINFFSLASPFSTFFARALQRDLARVYNPSTLEQPRLLVPLSPQAQEDLSWWASEIDAFSSSSFLRSSPHITITSDASKLGWGAVSCGKKTGGRWSASESLKHINWLELCASFFSLRAFGQNWKDICILLELDNTTAIAYIRKRGGTTSPDLTLLAKDMWVWAAERNITLLATHRPGHLNSEADFESRSVDHREFYEFSLDPAVAVQLFNSWGKPDIDLFASRLNSKCDRFISLHPDPFAHLVDAFAQNWSGLLGYAFPPFILIGRVIRKAVRDGASLLLITPLWPSQAWFPLALTFSKELPVVLPQSPYLITDPEGRPSPLLRNQSFYLLAWRISPPFGPSRGSVQKLSARAWPVGLPTL